MIMVPNLLKMWQLQENRLVFGWCCLITFVGQASVFVHAAFHFGGLKVKRFRRQPDFATLLKKPEHKPQKRKRTGHTTKEISQFVKAKVSRILSLHGEVDHQSDQVNRGQNQANPG